MTARGGDSLPREQPSADAVRAALDRVLAAEAFRAAPQLSAFLAFVVGRTLEGRGAELKGYTIAVEAFGRPADFDPQTDPIVRVEAGRLRRALGQYYAGEGQNEPVRIAMPVGTYVPVFALAELSEAPAGSAAAEQGQGVRAEVGTAPGAAARHGAAVPRSWLWLGLGLLATALVALGCWYLAFGVDRSGTVGQGEGAPVFETSSGAELLPSPPALAQVPHAGNLAVVAVLVPETPADPVIAGLMQRFSVLLIDSLVRFDDLVSVRLLPTGAALPTDVDYVFEMIAERSGDTVEGFTRLRSQPDGRIVWTDHASRRLKGGIEPGELSELARGLAARLAEPFGIIHADSRRLASAPGRRCMISAVDLRRTMTAADHIAARKCLQKLAEQEPGFYPAWAYLALLAVHENAQGIEPLSEPALDRALSAAVMAVRLAPSSARALQAMMETLFARGAIDDALKSGQEALARNPYDSEVMAALGARLVQLNRPVEGLPLLERAIKSSAGRPSWYDFYAFLAAHLLGETARADSFAALFMMEETPAGLLGRAMRAGAAGDKAALEELTAKLARIAPVFAADPALYLKRRGFVPEVAQRMLTDLGIAAAPK